MSKKSTTQSLSYPLRLPDAAQTEALRLLDTSRAVINQVITLLWPRLDEFNTHTNTYVYKQVEALIVSPQPHGNRQFRCEAEQAGRLLRSQARRKLQFALIHPILAQGMLIPKTETARARTHRPTIKQALEVLRQSNEDGGNAVELLSVVEQACNFYLKNGCFPAIYEEMQEIPVMSAAQLPYAGDDGGTMGQAYRMTIDLREKQITLALRAPDVQGNWSRDWRDHPMLLPIPAYVLHKIEQGTMQAPVLREIKEPNGTRYAVLDVIVEVSTVKEPEPKEMSRVLGFDWGVRTLLTMSVVDLDERQVTRPFFLSSGCFDGEQARTRRQIDELKAKVATLEKQRDRFAVGDARREPNIQKLGILHKEISLCWRKYEARNHDLAHAAANVLLVIAVTTGCSLIAGEALKSMKSQGRGHDAKGKWRNWRNNTQVRGEIWRILKYKCFLAGIHLEWQQPRGTSHTCPRCGEHADTYRSPAHLGKVIDWGAWLYCKHCGWNGSRDYTASLNIARLGVAWLKGAQRLKKLFGIHHPQIQDKQVKPVSYIGTGSLLRFPARSPRACLLFAGKMYYNGWLHSVTLHSSYPTAIMLDACG
jgi:transposase